MKKVYLAHPISTTGEFNDSIRVAERIKGIYKRSTKYIVHLDDEPKYNIYAPALNKAINDKTNNPTPQMIYEQDVEQLLSADIVVVNYTGGDADGTVLELGLLAGMFECTKQIATLPTVFVYSSNKRALQPQIHNGIASGKLNHMVLGAIDKHFTWLGNEDEVIECLKEF